MLKQSEKAGDRIQGNTFGCFVIYFSLAAYCTTEAYILFMWLVLPEEWAVDTTYISVRKSSYLDTTKTQVEIKTSFSFLFWIPSSSMEDCFWNFPSHLAKWLPPVSYLCFLKIVMVFSQMYVLFSWGLLICSFLSSISKLLKCLENGS